MTYPVSWSSLTSTKSFASEKKIYSYCAFTPFPQTATPLKSRGKACAQYILYRDHDNG